MRKQGRTKVNTHLSRAIVRQRHQNLKQNFFPKNTVFGIRKKNQWVFITEGINQCWFSLAHGLVLFLSSCVLVKIKITLNHQLKITILVSVSQGSAGCNLALEGQPVPGRSSHFVKGSAFDAMLQQFQPPVWPISWPGESLFACLSSAAVGDVGHATLLYGCSHCGWHPKSAQCPLCVLRSLLEGLVCAVTQHQWWCEN